MDEGSRTILAIVLSMLIVLAWFKLYPKLFPPVSPPAQQESTPRPTPAPRLERPLPSYPAIEQKLPSVELSPQAKEITVHTPFSKIVFTTQGARALHWFIKERGDRTFDLIPAGNLATLPLDLQIENLPTLANEIFVPDKEMLILNSENKKDSLSFHCKTSDGLEISKIFTFSSQGYLAEVDIIVANPTSRRIYFPKGEISWNSGIHTDQPKAGRRQQYPVNVIAWVNGKVQRKLKSGFHQIQPDWVAIDSQYFLVAFLPEAGNFSGIEVKVKPAPGMSLVSPATEIFPGQKNTQHTAIYAGPKKHSDLKKLGMHLERAVNFGFFGDISKAMLWLLNFFARGTRNYGWAIVILAFLLQLAMSPLSLKSFKSMQAMQKVQPLMKQIQQKYKDDPKRMNAEMMELYKSKKVNPMGGCLPMLLQLPIFWGLFMALRNAFELRHAPFMFWIKDLSTYDPYYVLPIVMGGAMLLQQKLTAPSQPGAQGKMMMLMPIFFTFIFLKFPAGLVLYWLTSNIVSIAQQYLIKKTLA